MVRNCQVALRVLREGDWTMLIFPWWLVARKSVVETRIGAQSWHDDTRDKGDSGMRRSSSLVASRGDGLGKSNANQKGSRIMIDCESLISSVHCRGRYVYMSAGQC
jgi:hypothetical protein